MSKSTKISIQIAGAILLAIPFLLRADTPAAKQTLDYSKPAGATEKTRTDWKSGRGSNDKNIPEDLSLTILCPSHTGVTVQDHPSIFWYMNKPVKGYKCRFSITSDNDVEPLFEKEMDSEQAAGIHRIDLKDVAKPLQPNTDYRITLAIIVPSDQPNEPHTSGLIRRISASEKLISRLLSRPTPAERAVVYAHEQIWFDALAAISDQIAGDEKNKALHEERANLLKLGDLSDAAAYDIALEGK